MRSNSSCRLMAAPGPEASRSTSLPCTCAKARGRRAPRRAGTGTGGVRAAFRLRARSRRGAGRGGRARARLPPRPRSRRGNPRSRRPRHAAMCGASIPAWRLVSSSIAPSTRGSMHYFEVDGRIFHTCFVGCQFPYNPTPRAIRSGCVVQGRRSARGSLPEPKIPFESVSCFRIQAEQRVAFQSPGNGRIACGIRPRRPCVFRSKYRFLFLVSTNYGPCYDGLSVENSVSWKTWSRRSTRRFERAVGRPVRRRSGRWGTASSSAPCDVEVRRRSTASGRSARPWAWISMSGPRGTSPRSTSAASRSRSRPRCARSSRPALDLDPSELCARAVVAIYELLGEEGTSANAVRVNRLIAALTSGRQFQRDTS